MVRRRCLEILDNHLGETAVPHFVRMLDDLVPRVRWHAIHALECETCKSGENHLTPEIEVKLRRMAVDDANARVRRAAAQALGE